MNLPWNLPGGSAKAAPETAVRAFAVAVTTPSGDLRSLTSASLLGEDEARAEAALWAAHARREGGDPNRYVIVRVVPEGSA